MNLQVEPIELKAIQKSNIVQQTTFWARVKFKQGIKPLAFQYKATEDLLHPRKSVKKRVQNDILVLITHIDQKHSIAYVPYSPKDEPDAENHGMFLEELSESLRPLLPQNCILIRYDLPWESQWSAEEDFFDSKGNWTGPPTIRNQEFRVNFNTNNWNLLKSHSNILPSNTIFLDLKKDESDLLAAMKPKTRYNIKLSLRKGVRVKSHGLDKLDKWYALYKETAERNGVHLHDIEYFRTVLTSRSTDLNAPVDVHLLMADHQGEFLAPMFLILSKKRATYLYGASSNSKRNMMATYAIQWEAIRLAQKAGCEEYDMFGSSPNANPAHPMSGLYRFKAGFGGSLFHSMGCWDYPLNFDKYKIFRAEEVNSQKYHTS